MSEPALRSERGSDGVLVVTLDVPGEKVNVLSRAMVGDFQEMLRGVEADHGLEGSGSSSTALILAGPVTPARAAAVVTTAGDAASASRNRPAW